MDGDTGAHLGGEPYPPSPWSAPTPGWEATEPAPFPGAPVPPQPVPSGGSRSRRFGRGTLIVVAVAVSVLSGAGGAAAVYTLHGRGAGTSTAMSSPSPSATAGLASTGLDSPPPTPARLRDGKALLAQILPVPAGAETLAVDDSTNGVLDLDQYVARYRDGAASAKADLRARGFQVAAERDWVGTDGVEVDILLAQFEDTEGALGYVLNQTDAYNRDPKYTVSFVIPSASHGAGYEATGFDAAGNHRVVLIAQDGRLKVTIFLYPPRRFDRAGEIALMQRQLAFIT